MTADPLSMPGTGTKSDTGNAGYSASSSALSPERSEELLLARSGGSANVAWQSWPFRSIWTDDSASISGESSERPHSVWFDDVSQASPNASNPCTRNHIVFNSVAADVSHSSNSSNEVYTGRTTTRAELMELAVPIPRQKNCPRAHLTEAARQAAGRRCSKLNSVQLVSGLCAP